MDGCMHRKAPCLNPQLTNSEDNEYRTQRTAEILFDFRTLQYYIAAAPVDPTNSEDYYTEGWAALRQCSLDGQHILNCAADTSVPQTSGGEEEQVKAELKQVALDAYARRHEGQKIYLRQAAAQRWVEYREQIFQGNRPSSSHRRQLRACDEQLRNELNQITDEAIYNELQASDIAMGRWTGEDPSLRSVQCWLRTRQRTTRNVLVDKIRIGCSSRSILSIQWIRTAYPNP